METDPQKRARQAAREQARAEEVQAILAAALLEAWRSLGEDALQSLGNSLLGSTGQEGARGGLGAEEGGLEESDIDEVVGQLRPFLSDQMVSDAQEAVSKAVEASYTIGQETISVEAAAGVSVEDRRLKNFLQDNALFWVGNHYDQQVQERIREAAEEVFENEDGVLGRRKAAQKFREAFEGEFQKSESYWQLLANDVTTKSREFGRVEGMVKAGIEEYAIDAILDSRTSEICRYLDGKTFKVEDAVEQREKLMEAQTPQAVKRISPWLDPDVLTDLEVPELTERGVILPPFHGNCRSRIQAV